MLKFNLFSRVREELQKMKLRLDELKEEENWEGAVNLLSDFCKDQFQYSLEEIEKMPSEKIIFLLSEKKDFSSEELSALAFVLEEKVLLNEKLNLPVLSLLKSNLAILEHVNNQEKQTLSLDRVSRINFLKERINEIS
ncbi:MAG TPA: hypothetical protein VNG53_04360 [Bacteroidia bacterium]|nr:hypothetical protein [Bacteroidia bacterium]